MFNISDLSLNSFSADKTPDFTLSEYVVQYSALWSIDKCLFFFF